MAAIRRQNTKMRRVTLGLGAAGALLILLAGSPTRASAVTCDQSFAGAGPSVWEFDETDGEMIDATLFTELGFDVVRDDAFDDYGVARIDGIEYQNPDDAGCRVPQGRHEILFPADVVNDIRVKPQLYVSGRKPFARQFVSLRNPTAGPLTVDFSWDGDLGSDSGTSVAATSSGDAAMNEADRWATTCEDFDEDGCVDVAGEVDHDPELAHNWEGKGDKKHSADLVADSEVEDANFEIHFDDVTIGAGKTVSFLQVVSLTPTIRAANNVVRAVDRNPARYGVFAKLAEGELRTVQNWKKPRRRGG
jgi:hypothetical protein